MEEYSFEVCEMKKDLENLIKAQIDTKCFDEAVDLISKTLGQIPHFSILQDIIYKVLMKTDKKSTAINALSYLTKVVEIYPPTDQVSRLYYWYAVNEKNKKIDLFEVFSNIIRNCLKIPELDQKTNFADNVIYNNEFLLQYFYNVLHTDFENFAAERSENGDIKKCLLAKVFFKNDKISTQGNFEQLLQWINVINKNHIKYQMDTSAALLQDLLALVLDLFLFDANRSEAESVNHEQLDEIAHSIFRQCNDSFKTCESLKRFLSMLSVRWARIKICENLVYKLIYPSEPYSATTPLTLRKIIRRYMFPPFSNDKTVEKTYQPPNGKSLEKRNRKAGIPTINLNLVNNDGRTPLHCAVMVDSVDIAEDLLTHGELNTLLIKDNEGKIPIDRARSEDMKQLLRDYECRRKNMIVKAENFYNIDMEGCPRKPPVLKDCETYDIYLLCLNNLLLDYMDMFQLKSVRKRKKYDLKKTVKKHLVKKCRFVYNPTIHDLVARFDDFFCLERLPSIIREFSSELIAQTSPESIDVSTLLFLSEVL